MSIWPSPPQPDKWLYLYCMDVHAAGNLTHTHTHTQRPCANVMLCEDVYLSSYALCPSFHHYTKNKTAPLSPQGCVHASFALISEQFAHQGTWRGTKVSRHHQ